MFDIGWSEFLIIGIVALIAIGPKELPGVLRTLGQYMGKIRRMASEFQGQFNEAMREAEMADLKKQVDEMTSAASDFGNYDPMESVRNEVDRLNEPPQHAADTSDSGVATASPEAASAAIPGPVSSEFELPPPDAPAPPAADAADTNLPPPKVGGAG